MYFSITLHTSIYHRVIAVFKKNNFHNTWKLVLTEANYLNLVETVTCLTEHKMT